MPQQIGRYAVLGELGHGGMAVVYRALDPRLEREVAVKVLHPHLARDEESRARFGREARAAARLRHPNIVEVYEFSDDDEEQAYLVTELLSGPTLRRFVDAHPDVPAEVAATIGIVLCDALSCAHRQGVVHRDVKPDNLMLQGGTLKLTDFGIAHVADMREMTATGQVLGSPAHMAPEQIEGTTVDARTDVFATGTVLYALTTGRLPFDGPNAHSLLRKILDGEYTDPLRVSPKVGHRFAAILRCAMARVPSDRYSSAEVFKRALEDFIAEVGWTVPEVALRQYLNDPDGVTETLRATLLQRLPALGEEAQAKGDLPEAMGYFNRALALDPGNARVLGLLRRAARRRELKRNLRAAGLVSGVATVTAGVVFAVIQARPPVRPGVPVVAETPAEGRVEAVTPRVQSSETARPPEVVDAGVVAEVATAVEPAGPARRPTGRPDRSARVSGERDAGTSAPVQYRMVMLVPNPMYVHYSVNGGPDQQYDSRAAPLRLPVGVRATIVVEHNLPGWETRRWTGVIPAGSSESDVYRVLLALRPHVDPDGAPSTP